MNEGIIRICLRREDFRMSFTDVFPIVFTLTLVPLELFFFFTGAPLFILAGVIPVLLTVLSTLAGALICWAFHFEVGPNGLEWVTLLRTDHIPWTNVNTSRRVGFLGLDWLVIETSDSHSKLWLPLFVRRYHLLRDLLVTFGDPRWNWDQQLPQR
ncbi:MAG: hypothetical protein KDA88_12065 [Planctomycetaceae bacterium]|nr:hypothetical protein [Planctomycetaceae bacterium]MCB9951585.1 hypothetical protein [Planctomycetaceae bacterium]